MRPLLLLAAGLFAVTGCSTDADPAPVVAPQATATVTTTTTAPATVLPPATTAPDLVFLAVLHDAYPRTETVPDSTWTTLAESACDAFDAGMSKAQALTLLLGTDAPPEDREIIAYAVGAGVEAYCPEHSSTITK